MLHLSEGYYSLHLLCLSHNLIILSNIHFFSCKEHKSIPEGCILQKVDRCCSELVCSNKEVTHVLSIDGITNVDPSSNAINVVTNAITNQGVMPGDGFVRPPKDGFLSQAQLSIDQKEGRLMTSCKCP